MKQKNLSGLSLWAVAGALLLGFGMVFGQESPEEPETTPEETETVTLDPAPFQEILNQLFGTPEETGILGTDKTVLFHGAAVALTTDEAKNFFSPATPTETDFASLVAGFHDSKRGNVQIAGTVDGAPFNFKIAGRQLHVEGISLTQAELDTLVASLRDIPGLHNVKIGATVDGEPVSVHLQNRAGRLRIGDEIIEQDAAEIGELPETEDGSDPRERGGFRGNENGNRSGRDARNERAETSGRHLGWERAERAQRMERMERPEKPERPERPERVERVQRMERFERPERPGRGRN